MRKLFSQFNRRGRDYSSPLRAQTAQHRLTNQGDNSKAQTRRGRPSRGRPSGTQLPHCDPWYIVLTIAFHNGSVYEYADLPEVIYQDLMGSRSKGKFFHEKILDVYAATRV